MKVQCREVSPLMMVMQEVGETQDLISGLAPKFITFWLCCITEEISLDRDMKKAQIYVFHYDSPILHASHPFQMSPLLFQAPEWEKQHCCPPGHRKGYDKYWSTSNIKSIELYEGTDFSVNEVSYLIINQIV